ncbi:phenylpropionate dioxygenase-like ring-hydroxylating dioxygenase large terminal subunit [Azospirillum agricola]|uniref:Rieske 2Fe-2S domain-containing protein n=1 Tax=Azospirillum agricola TaxID=1720247 RepID=UPI001AE17996|nr:Rieske 2Fe-2S domain-containing protein [Azospirillum agricola]MBP2232920.1 phenylpropionate dioxygenase-like ring-hydroxylating dioxygenase large terminal subunit [Azospirillum agricola]
MTEAVPDDTRWFYLCTEDDLAVPNAFVTTRVGAVPLVAQNLKGRVVAFRNVCTHRFAIIHDAASGCGPLRCPYHGWTFDAEGVPVGLPFNPTDFQLDAEGRRRLALNPASLARCGRLVFVRVATEGPALKEQLGNDLFTRLADLSETFSRSGEPMEPGEDWEGFETANLRVALRAGHALHLEALPPPGAGDRFARTATFLPVHADTERPA